MRETYVGDASRLSPMTCGVAGPALSIGYGDWSALRMGGCSVGSGKQLVVSIPTTTADQLERFCLDGASGTYRLEGFSAHTIELTLASGTLDAGDVGGEDLSLQVASGKATISGTFAGSVGVDVASGKVAVNCVGTAPVGVNIDVASGTVNVGLPADAGFVATVDKLSGSFSCDAPATNAGDTYAYGDEATQVTVSIMSGNVKLGQV